MSFFHSARSGSNPCCRLVKEHSSLVKRIVLFLLLAALMMLNLHSLHGSVSHYYGKNPDVFPVDFITPAAVCSFLLFCILIAFALFRNLSIEKYFLLSFISVGIVYTFLFPPTTVPDETTHFYSAYYLSNYLCCPQLQHATDALLLREMDFDAVTSVFSNQTSFESLALTLEHFRLFDSSQSYIPFAAVTAFSVSPLGYIVPAIAIAFGRLLHLGIYPLFYLGRLSNVLLYSLIVYSAIRRTPFGKPVLFVISFLPMTAHLVSSFSYDGYTIGFSMLLLADCLYWIKSNETLHFQDLLRLSVLGIFVTFAKCVYLPLILMVLLIPCDRFSPSTKKSWYMKCGIIALCIFCFLLYYVPSLSSDLSSYDVLDEAMQTYSIGWVLSHIPATIGIFFRTATQNYDRYLYELLGQQLGWFQIQLDFIDVLPFFLYMVLAASVVEDPSISRSTPLIRLTMLFAVFCCVGLVFASMFFNWTRLGDLTISGIQGRYFLPLLFPLFLIVENKKLSLDRDVLDCLLSMVIASSYIIIMQILIHGFL